tara:strand:+ start:960 stop:2036 length:1077 start_codon:yes stop_codon:yes gene_type:complete
MANVLDTDYSFLNLPTAGSNVPGPINLPKFDPSDFTFQTLKNRTPVDNLVASRMFPLSGPNDEGMNNDASVGAIEKLGATLGKQVSDLQSQLDALTAENNSLLAERDSAVSQLEQVSGAQQDFSSQAANYENTIADLQNQIQELQNVQQPPADMPPPPPIDVPPVNVPGGGEEPTVTPAVVVFGPDGTMYGSPAAAEAAGVTNYTMTPPGALPIPPKPPSIGGVGGRDLEDRMLIEQRQGPPPLEDIGFGPGIRRSEDFLLPEELRRINSINQIRSPKVGGPALPPGPPKVNPIGSAIFLNQPKPPTQAPGRGRLVPRITGNLLDRRMQEAPPSIGGVGGIGSMGGRMMGGRMNRMMR